MFADQEGLQRYLWKCEIEYIASHGGGIIPICEKSKCNKVMSEKDIEDYIKFLGFKVKGRFETDNINWIRTTSNISIALNDGFCVKG